MSAAAARIERLLAALDEEQRDAVTRPCQPLLVLASAGTGKTRVLTHRAAFLIMAGLVRPQEVVAITFTKRAAGEMRGRLRILCGDAAGEITIGTFHSVCSRILRAHASMIGRSRDFSICHRDGARRAIEAHIDTSERAMVSPTDAQREISLCKNQGVSLAEYEAHAQDEVSVIVARAWAGYEQALERADALDFDDLLYRTGVLLEEQPRLLAGYQQRFRAFLVDEYQDTNPVQARLLRLLAATGEGSRNLTVAGDDDQAIFAFRLADIGLILDFEVDYRDAQVVTLQLNYRSTSELLHAAHRQIEHNHERRTKTPQLDDPARQGEPIEVHCAASGLEEARWIAEQIAGALEAGASAKQIAVLARKSKVLDRIEHALVAEGVAYRLLGASGFFEHTEIKAALAHLRLLDDPSDETALTAALQIRPYIGAQAIEQLIAIAAELQISPLEAAAASERLGVISGVTARQNTIRFGQDMRALAAVADKRPVSWLTRQVIEMPLGPMQALLASAEDEDERPARLKLLIDAARAYENVNQTVSLRGFLQRSALSSEDGNDTSPARITLIGIHAAKGLEWDTVIGAGIENGIMPSGFATSQTLLEEERRVGYVLLTRARRTLWLSYALMRDGRPATPSPYIVEATGPHAIPCPA
jgi:DNA helicase-2/ATP-dependent DNA helicase PcrA